MTTAQAIMATLGAVLGGGFAFCVMNSSNDFPLIFIGALIGGFIGSMIAKGK
jgi:hypothetical protein